MKNLSASQNARKTFVCFKTAVSKIFSVLLPVVFFMISGAYAQAPVISYPTPQVYYVDNAISPVSPTNTGGTVPNSTAPVTLSGSFTNLTGIAIDASGNVYVAENGKNDVREIPAAGGSILTFGSGFNQPCGVAVDVAGNVYVTDFGNNAIEKIPAGNGTIVTVASGLGGPYGIAIDGAGNLYFSEFTAGHIKKISAGSSTPAIIGSGFSNPTGIAVDVAGNVYLTDRGHNAIKKILASNGTVSTLSAGGGNPNGVTVDASGNVYFADTNLTTITEIPVGGGSNVAIGSGFSAPTSVALDAGGDLFIGDKGNSVVKEISTASYKISPALPVGLSINAGTGVISGTPTAGAPATNYTVTATNRSGSGNAVINVTVNVPAKPIISYSTPQTYVVPAQAAITPLVPVSSGGPLAPTGAFSIKPALPAGLSFDVNTGIITGTPLAAVPATNYTVTATNGGGSGTAVINITINTSNPLNFSYSSPQVYYPTIPISPLPPLNTGDAIPGPTPVTLGTLAVNITAMAVDTSGSIYIVGSNSTGVTKLTGNTVVTLGSTLLNPTGVAVDAAGNIFIADAGHNDVKEIPAGSKTIVNYLFSIENARQIAVDAADNIYVSTGDGTYKVTAGTKNAILIGGGNDTGIAVDASGNVYNCDANNLSITEIPVGTGKTITLATGLSSPGGIAIDAKGNIFYAQNNNLIMELPAGGGAAFPVVTGLTNATSVAVDRKGNIFTESGGTTVQEAPFGIYSIAPALPLGLTFDRKTGIISGTPLALTPAANYTVIASNANGSSATTVNIAVTLPPKPNISYSTPQTYNVGTPVSISPTNTGGAVPTQQPVTLISVIGQPIRGLAVDATGNIYIAFYNSSIIYKYPPGGGTPTYVGSGFYEPSDVALDGAGNLFVADDGNHVVKEVLASNGSVITYASGFSTPQGVAVDASGNVYVSDFNKNTLYKIPAGGGTPIEIATNLNSPAGIAVDPAGNVYVANTKGNNIKEVLAGTSTAITFATGFNTPYDVAVDPVGNVFVADKGEAAVKRIPAGGGTPVAIAQAIHFQQPGAIALDANGNIYIGDWSLGAIYEINPGYFINPTLPAGLSIDQNTGIISGTSTVKSAKTNYSVSARNSGGVSVATIEITVNPYQKPTIAYATPQVYAVNTAITPLLPKSSVVFPASFTRSATSFASSLTGNEGVAVDAAGNVYVAEPAGNQVVQIAAGGTITPLGSGFSGPTGVALDAAKNVYVTDYGNHAVKEITTGGTVLTLGSGFTNPLSVAVDRSGNVYVADNGFGIKKIPAGNGTPVTIAPSTFNNATAVAVDGYGNVFFTLGGVYEILASNSTVKQFNNRSATGANSVAVDANGDIFYSAQIISNSNRAVYEIPAGDTVSTQVSFGSASVNADNIYLAVNGPAVLYLSDPTAGTVTRGVPTGGYFINQVLPAGLNINTGTGVISGTPAATSPAANYIVTGYNTGGSGSGTVNIKTVASTNASLTNLAVSSGTLTPAFATATTGYSVTEPYTTTSITIKPTAGDGTATILVNGVSVASGAASAGIPLSVGANTIGITVTDSGGTTVSNYTITANRTGNASLANFAVNAGTLDPTFAPGTFNYSVTMPGGVSAIVVTPTLADTTGTITINGKAIATGTASPNIQLAVGPNTITTVTTAANGATTQTYTLTATRQSPNAGLASLHLSNGTLSPAFAAATFSYSVTVANAVTSLMVTPTTDDVNATVAVNGTTQVSGMASAPITLNVGANTITVVVTAPDGVTTKTYTITVNRTGSANDNLSSLTLSQGTLSPVFASGTVNYTAAVANTVSSITVTLTTADANATVTINGIAPSGGIQPPISLNVGANTITVVVTAPDGVTTKTYTLTVTRTASTNDKLSALIISQGTLSPVFASGTSAYTASVANSITSLTITPTTSDPDATVEVNGSAVTSGVTSGSITLAVGANTVSVTVTASDGVSTKTYTIMITRNGNSNANLAGLTISRGTLTPIFRATTVTYTDSVVTGVTSMTVTPIPGYAAPDVTVKINGTAVTLRTASAPINLNFGANVISVAVTSSDGTTTKTYTITVTRAAAPSADLSAYEISAGVLTPAFSAATTSYTVSVDNGVTTMEITPTTADPTASVKVRGTPVASGKASSPIALAVGANTINTIVVASNGTNKTYVLTVTRAAASADSFVPGISVTGPTETPIPIAIGIAKDGIVVHQGVSPNGDGINDFLVIENINQYPENKLTIMNRNGQMIYEASGYDNSSKVFDGHSNKNGRMQLPGTYFYQLAYTVKGITKHKTGFLVLKY